MGTLQTQTTLSKQTSAAFKVSLHQYPSGSGRVDVGSMNMDEFLSVVWDRDQGPPDGSEASDMVAAGNMVHSHLNGSSEKQDLSGRPAEEVWRAIQRNGTADEGSYDRIAPGSFLHSVGVEISPQSRTAMQAPARAAAHPFLVSTSAVDGRKVDNAYTAPPPPASSRPNGDAQWQRDYEGRGASARVARPVALSALGAVKGKEAIPAETEQQRPSDGKVGVFQISGVNGWSADAAYPATMQQQERYAGQMGQSRGSGPASSAESHPGSSTADLSHVAPFQSAPASTLQENPKPTGGGARGARQRKRKEPEITDERSLRQHKRMVKNRESAARSRARKQQYTTELEIQVEKLKQDNRELTERLLFSTVPPQAPPNGRPVLRRTRTTPPRWPTVGLLD